MPIADITHPIAGIPVSDLASRAVQVVDRVDGLVAEGAAILAGTERPVTEVSLRAPVEGGAFYELALARGWTDGFPVVAPTLERVERMLAANGVDPATPLGILPPRQKNITARDVATNAVLAGCPDAAYPVVAAALRAAQDPAFNLIGVLSTTHPCTVAVIVSGPIADRLGINSGASLYGVGNRLNATIGRAVRLALQNLGAPRR